MAIRPKALSYAPSEAMPPKRFEPNDDECRRGKADHKRGPRLILARREPG
jgi:hypothetical protein